LGPVVLILILIETLVTFAWFLWVGQKVFFGVPADSLVAKARQQPNPPASMQWTLIAMIVVTVLAPIAAIPIVSRISLP